MPDVVTVRVDGLRELGERLRSLSAKVATKVARSATNAAAQVIKKQAKKNIESNPSIETGSLLDAVIVKKVRSELTSEHIVTVRGKGKRKNKGKQRIAPHAHLIEFGTVKMPAEPFLKPSFDARKADALKAMTDKLRKAIEKA